MKLQAWLVPTLLAFGVPLAAHAQSSPSRTLADQTDQDETVYLSPFEVSSDRVSGYNVSDSASARIRRPLLDTPNSIQIVTSEFMDSIGAGSILDATQYLSGMSIPPLGGVNGIQERQVIRGFNAYGVGIDGFRLRTNAAQLDPSVLDRVEVIKGPNTVVTPGTFIGGFGTTVTKSPQFKMANSLKVELADKYFGSRAVIDSTGIIPGTERFAYRMIGTYRDAKSYIPGRVFLKTLNPMLTWRISGKSQLKLKAILNNWGQNGIQAQNDNSLQIRDDFSYGTGATVSHADIKPGYVPFGANGRVDWTSRLIKTRLYSAVFTTELTSNLNLRLAVLRESVRGSDSSWRGVQIDEANLLRVDPHTGRDTPTLSWALKDPNLPYDKNTNPYESTPILLGSDITKVKIHGDINVPSATRWEHNNHLQADLASSFDFGGSSSEPLFTLNTVGGAYHTFMQPFTWYSFPGLEEDITATYDKTQPFLPNAPRPLAPIPDPLLPDDIGRLLQAETTQYYITAQLETFRKRLLLSGGWVYYKTVRDEVVYTQNRRNYSSESRGTPQFGVVYKVTPYLSVYGSHSENSSLGRYYPVVGQPDSDIRRDIEQEEVGVKVVFFDQRLSISSSYFDISWTNIAVNDPRDVEANRSGINRLYPTLLNEQTNTGIEFDIAGQITPNLSILGSYTKQKKRNQVGYREANTPDTMYNGFIRYGFSSGTLDGLSVHLGFNYSGKSPGNNPSINPTALGVPHQYQYFLPSRTIFNVGAGYRWKNVNFQLNIDNLLDEDRLYTSTSRKNLSIVPPRNIRLTTTYHF